MDWLRTEVTYKVKGLQDKIERTKEDIAQKEQETHCLKSFLRVTEIELQTLENIYEIILQHQKT